MMDPKVVELGIYRIPQLLVPVVTDPRKGRALTGRLQKC